MALQVEIQSIDATPSEVTAQVKVSTTDAGPVSYEIDINNSPGGQRQTYDDLVTGIDPDTLTFSFDPQGETSGTVTATFLEPESAVGTQDQVGWEVSEGEIEVNSCSADVDSFGTLTVSYTLAPTTRAASGSVDVSVSVGGQEVSSSSHFVPDRGGSFSQTVPSFALPTGRDMPVEITLS